MNSARAFVRERSAQFVFRTASALVACTLLLAGPARAQLDNVRMTAAATWLNAHQSPAGSWGSVDELAARDTARVLHAYFLTQAATTFNFDGAGTTLAQNRGLAWLASLPLDANQLLAEQAMAMTAGGRDATAVFARLLQQRSALGADFGGFADHSGDTYDSALALEAFATNQTLYGGSISGIITTLAGHQNADGGWGVDGGFTSNPLLTAEVLVGIGSLSKQIAPPTMISAAQAYVLRSLRADGSFDGSVLLTAVAFRGLVLTQYSVSYFSGATMQYFTTTQGGDGSYGGGDAYVTARVLEALYSNKANLIIKPGDFTISPSTTTEGTAVTATVKVSNVGTALTNFYIIGIYAADAMSVPLATVATPSNTQPGGTVTATVQVPTIGLSGNVSLVALADTQGIIPEIRKDDNTSSPVTLTVNGKPDLWVAGNDITTSPSHLQPNQPSQLLVTIHNGGQSGVNSAGYAVYDSANGAAETLLSKATAGPIAANGSVTVQIPVTFNSGNHTIHLIADPDNLIVETRKTNNEVKAGLAVTNLSNVDLYVRSVTVSPSRPDPFTAVTITATIGNSGTVDTPAYVAFYDGVPGAGGVRIATQTSYFNAQSVNYLTLSYTTSASSKVIYAVADPDNILSEMDETNNSGFATLTDQLTDLEINRDGIVFPKPLPSAGQSVTARVIVQNKGLLPASHAEVVLYDDLPQSGGVQVLDTFVDVPAAGSVVVPATWNLRPGQRIATATVNATKAIFEADYSNNRAKRYYAVNGFGPDISCSNCVVDRSHVVIDPTSLNVSGYVTLSSVSSRSVPIVITVFEDVDGDMTFDPEVDNVLGSVVDPVDTSDPSVNIPLNGSVRFAPGRLLAYLDSGNAWAEASETNNIIDLNGTCLNVNSSIQPRVGKWATGYGSSQQSVVARAIDTNGDGVIDGNDAPVVFIATNGGIVARRGDTGAILWAQPIDTTGRQISPVIADLDGDGKPEVLAHLNTDPVTGATNQHRLVALNAADGSRKWVSAPLDRDPRWESEIATNGRMYSYGGAPVVADLDGDGRPEVIVGRTVLNGADGTTKWVGAGGSGRAWIEIPGSPDLYAQVFPDQEAPVAVDVDGDGVLDVLAGNTVYRADGTILWQRTDLPDGYAAPVWVNTTDTKPHICLVAQGKVWLLNSDGTPSWGPQTIQMVTPKGTFGALLGGAPTVYRDGSGAWIAVAGDGFLSVFSASTGSVRWTTQVAIDMDSPFGTATNAPVIFDIQNPGFHEMFYVSRDQAVILNPGNGDVQYAAAGGADPYYAAGPSVADIDDDGHGEVLMPNRTAVQIFADGSWSDAPAIYNEFSYHATNVTDERGTIPAHETLDSFARAGFRSQRAFTPTDTPYKTNLTVSYPRVDDSNYPASVGLIVRAGNSGPAPSPSTSVTFRQSGTSGTSTVIGTVFCDSLSPGAYRDVVLTVPNPPAQFSWFAVIDAAGVIDECNEADNTSPTTTLHLSADIQTSPALLSASDVQPRPGDPVDLTARAFLTGKLNTANLFAQFYLGNPASGGTAISPLLPVILLPGSVPQAAVSYQWIAAGPSGPAAIYVVFDPQNLIPEDDETNNSASVAVVLSTADPIQKLSGALTLTPPAVEAGTPVRIDAVVQNIGNVALSNTTLTYVVTGGPASGASGSAAIASLAKTRFATLTLGTFTPLQPGTYTVTAAPSDPAVTLLASPVTITVGPFAAGMLTAVPSQVPVTLPLVQVHAHVNRANTINIPLDPLLPLVRASVQRAMNALAGEQAVSAYSTCFACHAEGEPMVAAGFARKLGGVDPTASENIASAHLQADLDSTDGRLFSGDPYSTKGKTRVGAWAVSYWHDGAQAAAWITPMVGDYLTTQQQDGSWNCDDGCVAGTQGGGNSGKEGATMMAVDVLTRAYELTGDASLLDPVRRAAIWLLAYDESQNAAATCEFTARVSIALAKCIPYLDGSTATIAKTRLNALSTVLRSYQSVSGLFGNNDNRPVDRQGQVMYALVLAGAGPDDPALRNATVWLLNYQKANGFFPLGDKVTGNEADPTTWAVAGLSAVWQKAVALNVDLHLTLPDGTDVASAQPAASSVTNVNGGHEYVWHFPDVSDSGVDLFGNFKLNGLQSGQSLPVASAASVSYSDPFTGQPVTHPVAVPTVTGFAPSDVALTTDHPSYGPNQNVVLTEAVRNAVDGTTTNVLVRDAAGTTVATLASGDPLAGLAPAAFFGWHYAIPITVPAAPAGVNRFVQLNLDFAQQLAALGISGTFDPNTLRVSFDNAPSSELTYAWLPGAAAATAGSLEIGIPDAVPAGTPLALHVYFDVIENGIKPASFYNRGVMGSGGFYASYYNLDTTKTIPYPTQPSGVFYFTPPVVSRFETTADLRDNFPFAAGLPHDYFAAIWSGALYIPTAGTYNFDLSSDDGSWLDIDGVQVINNGGGHGAGDFVRSVSLTAGFHTFKVTMFEWAGGEYLSLTWAPPGSGIVPIPAQNLFPAVPGTPPGTVIGTAQLLAGSNVTRTYTWNTAATQIGTYTAVASIYQGGTFLATANAPFTITPGSQLTASVATDKAAYDSGSTVHVTAAAQYGSGNTPLANLTAILSVTDPSAAVVATRTIPVAALQPGQTVNASLDWVTGNAAPGSYSATLTLKDASVQVLAAKSVPFTVRSTAQNGSGIAGTLTAAATVPRTTPLALAVTLHDTGNSAVTNGSFAVRIVNSSSQAPAGDVPFMATLSLGGDFSTTLSFDTTSLSEGGTYDAYLVSLIGGTPVELAKQTFTVTATPTVVTAGVVTDKTSYDVGDTVHATTTVTVVSAPAPLTNVNVLTTINGVTTTSTIASIAPGASGSVTVDWPVGTTAPGTYTVSVAVNGATPVTTTFTIISTATSGKGITGTLTAAGPVTQGQPIPLTATITDNGNAALTGAAFSVKIAGDTLPFTIDVPLGGSASKTLSYPTTTPGTYTATLTSVLTGDLATTTFTVNAIPTVVTAGVVTDKASYDVGNTVHATTTVNVVSAPAPLTNVNVLTTINGVTTTSTIASIAPGASSSVTVDWPAGTVAPGTYTVSVAVNGAAPVTTTFTIISTATSGKGITGTLTAAGPVTQGQPIPLTATITDSGNAALSGAAFSVKIGSDSLPFTIDVPLGGSASKTLSYPTTAPGTYTATLTSALTGDLAATTFTVNAIPTVVTAAVVTDKASYDVGNTVHATTTVTVVSAPAPMTNVNVLTTINGVTTTSTIASIAPGASSSVTVDWPVGTTAPGTYTVSVAVNGAAPVTTTFTIISTATSGKGITGTLTAAGPVAQGQPIPLTATITDSGNAALSGAAFSVKIGSDTLPFTIDVPMAGSASKTLSYPTTTPGTYTATLTSALTGDLATTTFTVNAIPTVVTAGVVTDKASYNVGDTVHATTTVTVVSAPAPLTNVNVLTTINGVTTTSTIASIAPGASSSVTVDWPVGTTAPGTYTVSVAVNGAAPVTTTFTIISTATSGKGISGTLTAAGPVTQGQPLPLTATIIDNGNAALTGAAFSVKIAGDTLPFTVDVPLGGSASKTLSYSTTAPGIYTATLTSALTGDLATTTFTVNAIPTVVTAAVVTDKASYDVGDTVHATTTVTVVSAPAPLTNVNVLTTINGVTTTSTIASIAPGANGSVTVDWPVGTTAPGTYTVSVAVNGATPVTTTFTIISTATSGKGITGTLTAAGPVTQGQPIPLTATITNSGNAALTDAPFAVVIGSDTLSFTASVPLGGSTSDSLTYATASLAPGTFSVALVSLITGQPVTLATASFTVTQPSTQPVLTNTAGSTARVLIWAPCKSNGNCTPPNPAFLTTTLTNAGMAWTLVADSTAFLTAVRSGGYGTVIFYIPPSSEAGFDAELSESIHAGLGLIVLDDHPDAMPKLGAALGMAWGGKLNASTTLLDLLATPLSSAGHLTVNGDGVQVSLSTARALALIDATQEPSFSYNTWGAGRTVVIPFDTEKTATAGMATLLVSAVRYVNRTASTDARSVVPLDVALTAPAGGSLNVTVTLTLAHGLTVVDALPHFTSPPATSWTASIPGGTTTHFITWVRLADAIGSYDATATLTIAGQTLATKTLTLTVGADRAALEAALASDLNALAAQSADKAIGRAQTALTAEKATSTSDPAGGIQHVLDLTGDLQSLSIDTTAARRDADRLLTWWQSGLTQ